MAVRSALFTVMERAARKAARGLVHDFNEVEQLQVSVKSPGDFVSAADRQAETVLRDELGRARPDYGFLGEEGGEEAGDGEHRWIVDPLDGTTNFLHGIPHFAISMALEAKGELVAGLVYNPVADEMYWAEKGRGAYLNHRRLRVSGRTRLGESLIGTGIPFQTRGDHARYLRTLEAVMEHTAGVRRIGAAALDLCAVAAGRFDGFWEYGLNPWDVAAGIVIIREAGGFVGSIDGRARPLAAEGLVAANAHLHQPLSRLLRDAERGRTRS